MANQPNPTCPWFRLPFLSRSPANRPKAPPPPRPGASASGSNTRAIASTQNSAREGLLPRHADAASVLAPSEAATTATKTPPFSPKTKSKEPNTKIPGLAEEDTVLVHKMLEESKEHIQREDSRKKMKSPEKHNSSSGNIGMRTTTAGEENQGPVKKVVDSSYEHKRHPSNEKSVLKSNTDSNEKEGVQANGKNHKANAMRSVPIIMFINSNVQGINNSLVCNSSFDEHDPGMHASLPC